MAEQILVNDPPATNDGIAPGLDFFVWHCERYHGADTLSILGEHLDQPVVLVERAREAVEEKSVGAIALSQTKRFTG